MFFAISKQLSTFWEMSKQLLGAKKVAYSVQCTIRNVSNSGRRPPPINEVTRNELVWFCEILNPEMN